MPLNQYILFFKPIGFFDLIYIGFTFAIDIASWIKEDKNQLNEFTQDVFITALTVLISQTDLLSEENKSQIVLDFMFTFTTITIMVNLLIAMLNKTYNSINETEFSQDQYLKLKLIRHRYFYSKCKIIRRLYELFECGAIAKMNKVCPDCYTESPSPSDDGCRFFTIMKDDLLKLSDKEKKRERDMSNIGSLMEEIRKINSSMRDMSKKLNQSERVYSEINKLLKRTRTRKQEGLGRNEMEVGRRIGNGNGGDLVSSNVGTKGRRKHNST